MSKLVTVGYYVTGIWAAIALTGFITSISSHPNWETVGGPIGWILGGISLGFGPIISLWFYQRQRNKKHAILKR